MALVFEYPTLNGGERSLLNCLEQPVFAGWQWVALAPQTGRLAEELRRWNLEHVPFSPRDEHQRKYHPSRAGQLLRQAIESTGADLVHANSLSMGRLTGKISPELSIPTTTHLRDILKVSGQAVEDLNLNRRLIAVSQATADFHINQGLRADRTVVIHNGVDTRLFAPRPATGDLKTELGLPPDAILLLNVGQIGLRKGQDVLADAAVGLASEFPQVHYLLAGERYSRKRESRDFPTRVQATFDDANLTDRVHWLGYREDVPRLMNESDLLVHTAHQEPLGRTLLEAAASGLPILTTDVGGTREILQNNVSARLIPPNDPARLAAAIRELLTHTDLPARFALAARQTVATHFRPEQTARRCHELWREVLG